MKKQLSKTHHPLSSSPSPVIVFGLFFSLLLFATPAQSYTRSLTSKGTALYWRTFPITYYINNKGAPGLPKTGTFNAFRNSFAAWSGQSCTCIKFEEGGITADTKLGYDQANASENMNLLIFQTEKNGWEHENQAVAVTSTTFKKEDGEIVAFDMEINAVYFTFSLDGKPIKGRATMDLQNTVTHEAGHVIGLDHSPNRNATMYAAGLPGEVKKRKLHQDDINGLCTIYPKEGGCINKPSTTDGCGCQSTNGQAGMFPLLLLLAFAFFLRKKMHKIT